MVTTDDPPAAPSGALPGEEERASALVATVVAHEGQLGLLPYAAKTPMAIFYDAAQMASTMEVMRNRAPESVLLPQPAIEGGTMPIHPATYGEQLPVQFQF